MWSYLQLKHQKTKGKFWPKYQITHSSLTQTYKVGQMLGLDTKHSEWNNLRYAEIKLSLFDQEDEVLWLFAFITLSEMFFFFIHDAM